MLNKSFCCWLFLCLSACSEQPLLQLSNDATILAFGDSLTAGVGVNEAQSYPSQLANLSQLKVINAGVSGETTAEGVDRFERLVEQINPDLIILLEGGNDILRNYPAQQTAANLAKMIVFAKQRNIPLILIGVPKKSLFSSSADFYAELADEYQVILDDSSISEIIRNPGMKSDSVHFNQKGYLKLANNIHQLLIESGALR